MQSMRSNDGRRKAFSKVMSYMQSRPGFGFTSSHLLAAFDWNSVGKVVDIGGGLGDTGKDIVRNTKATECVVQDLPDVIAEAEQEVEFDGRLRFMGHNFFEEQPLKDADVYFFRWVLHDWSDMHATNILRSLVPALKPGSSVIIQEFIIPPSGSVPFYHEKTIRCVMDYCTFIFCLYFHMVHEAH